ncbi:serpentine type 7TM GPCR chemoreceptor srv domain-containing protein [Ditylenchus destructor]|nr:serpentine type 7TM GPCR chemoreceptor srv domain-containing protein [Ditylenchus destructor]
MATVPNDIATGFLVSIANADPTLLDVSDINGYIAVGFSLITSFISCVLELRTFIAFRRMTEKKQREYSDDYKLLVYAMISLFSHLLMAIQYMFTYIVRWTPTFFTAAYPYLIDLLCLAGPICLFLTSNTLRIRYLKFYGFRKKNPTSDTSMSRIAPSKVKPFDHSGTMSTFAKTDVRNPFNNSLGK